MRKIALHVPESYLESLDQLVKEVHFYTDEGAFIVDEVRVDSLNRAYIKLVIFRAEQK